MAITIEDVARECNISKATVSRVLHKNPDVKEETRSRVLTVIKKLNYDPFQNIPLARHVKTKSLGIVLPVMVIGDDPDPFFFRAISSFKKVTSSNGYDCVLYSTEELEKKLFGEAVGGALGLACDALIFFCPHGNWNRLLKSLKQRDIPCLLVRRFTDVPGVPMIGDNDYDGGRLAMDHLFKLGHKRIAWVGGTVWPYLMDRQRAYRDFIKEQNLESDEMLEWDVSKQERYGREEWVRTVVRSATPPTAFFCTSDVTAYHVINALHAEGRRVPRDVSVVGYNNDYFANMMNPPLTTVNIPIQEMISLACRLAMDILDGGKMENVEIKARNELIVRGSCGAGSLPLGF
jgi:LacI family transcriptional regulator